MVRPAWLATPPIVTTTESAAREDEHLTTAAIAEAAKPEAGRPLETRTFADKGSAEADVGRQDADAAAPLFPGDEAKDLRARWDTIQAGFVDEPRQVVEQADELVATTMKRLAEIFAAEREKLEQQWALDWLAAFAVEPCAAFIAHFKRHLELVEKTMGGLLVLTGIAFLTGFVSEASFYLLEWFPALGRIG